MQELRERMMLWKQSWGVVNMTGENNRKMTKRKSHGTTSSRSRQGMEREKLLSSLREHLLRPSLAAMMTCFRTTP